MITRSYKALTSRPVFVLAAALAILMLAAPFVFAATSVNYPENSTDPVTTFSAMDQDGDPIEWSLAGEDAGDFAISDDGELTFKASPDFEVPVDDNLNNVYKVTVQASSDGQTATEALEVTVTDEDEPGKVTLSQPQPQVGRGLVATLNDVDAGVSDEKWQWARGASADGPWTDIDKATSASRNPVAADDGMYLQAAVTYEDNFGTGKTASMVTENSVEDKTRANAAPSFAHLDNDDGTVGSQVARAVDEGKKSVNVGKPVMARDADNDVLLYTLVAAGTMNDGDGNGAMVVATDLFSIDPRSGQLKTKVDSLDSDDSGTTGATADSDGEATYTVTVTATDPSGAPGTAMVIVTINDINDAPKITEGTAAQNRKALTVAENVVTSDDDADLDADPDNTDIQPPTYVAADDDAGDVNTGGDSAATLPTADITYAVEGADKDAFMLTAGGNGVQTLAFKSEHEVNYEKQKEYSISIVARDDSAPEGVGKVDVTVTVTNAEDVGEVELSQLEPQIGTPVIARLTDEDGSVRNPKWQWQRAATELDEGAGVLCSGFNGDWAPIDGENSPSYTPKAADIPDDSPGDDDANENPRCLRAMVTYTDGIDDNNPPNTEPDTATAITVREVQPENPANSAPKFEDDQDVNTPEDQADAERSVSENESDENVGDPVTALPMDGDLLLYSLSGSDMGSFKINRESGQITTAVKLDYETKDSYMVVVTATDPSGATDTINVNISVLDENDKPTITLGPGPPNNAPAFDGSSTTRMVAENAAAGAYVGDPVTATDEDDDSLTYSGGSMYFDVNDDGQIMVAEGAMLDYEMDDMHTVTVTASDGEDSDSITVTVMVTDMYPDCEMQGGDAANTYLNNDCEALLDSKDALGGSLNWAEAMPINDWDGFQNRPMPSLAGDPMRVTMLYLQNADLDGEIPAALGRLDALVYLNLHSNSLDGMVPDALGSLSNLERLYINDNELAGIGNLSGATSLEILWAHRNEMGGMVPTQLPSSLTQLMLFGNDLTGGIPDLSMLTSLERLYLSKNENLGGTIPATLGQLTSLTRLGLLDTGLTGDIADGLGSLVSLELLDLRDNMLNGSIPDEFGDMSSLKQLYLRENQLDGSIPDTLGQLASLERLWLHGNMLSGSIPMELGDLSALKQLHLNDNRLTGEIPSELGDLTNLERWFLSDNRLTGCVPAGLAAVADNDMAELGLTACQ